MFVTQIVTATRELAPQVIKSGARALSTHVNANVFNRKPNQTTRRNPNHESPATMPVMRMPAGPRQVRQLSSCRQFYYTPERQKLTADQMDQIVAKKPEKLRDIYERVAPVVHKHANGNRLNALEKLTGMASTPFLGWVNFNSRRFIEDLNNAHPSWSDEQTTVWAAAALSYNLYEAAQRGPLNMFEHNYGYGLMRGRAEKTDQFHMESSYGSAPKFSFNKPRFEVIKWGNAKQTAYTGWEMDAERPTPGNLVGYLHRNKAYLRTQVTAYNNLPWEEQTSGSKTLKRVLEKGPNSRADNLLLREIAMKGFNVVLGSSYARHDALNSAMFFETRAQRKERLKREYKRNYWSGVYQAEEYF